MKYSSASCQQVAVTVGLLMLGSLTIVSGALRLESIGTTITSGANSPSIDDAIYVQHLAAALMHIVPGILFMLIGPAQFIPGLRHRWPAVHRSLGKVFIVAGLLIALTGLWMNWFFPPVGGLMKALAVNIFSVALIAALLIAYRAIRRRDIKRHRAWMMRALAIGLGVSTQRLIIIPYFVLYGMPNDTVIGVGMWVGFLVNLLVVELILQRKLKPEFLIRTAT